MRAFSCVILLEVANKALHLLRARVVFLTLYGAFPHRAARARHALCALTDALWPRRVTRPQQSSTPLATRHCHSPECRDAETLDPIRCALCVKSSLDPGGIQRTKSNLSPERVHR
jgi:hypothetical protein